MNRTIIHCRDKYESQKLANLIFVNDTKETYIAEILNVVENEIILSIKDKSAHSVVLKDNDQVILFTDFIQSVIEKNQKIVHTEITENSVEIIKE